VEGLVFCLDWELFGCCCLLMLFCVMGAFSSFVCFLVLFYVSLRRQFVAIYRDYNIQQAIHTPLLGFDIVSCFLLLYMVHVVVIVVVRYIYVYKWAGTCMHIMMRCP
jgi:hypothetical protein